MTEEKRRNRAIVKLVIWSVVLCILFSLFMSLMSDRGNIFNFGWIGGDFSIFGGIIYDDNNYNVGSHIYSKNDSINVKTIDINWTSGSLNINVYDGDEIKCEEEGQGDDTDNFMRTKIENGKLVIKPIKSGLSWWRHTPRKTLNVYLPKYVAESLDTLDIDSASAKIFVSNINAKLFRLDTASGNVNLSDSSIGKLDVDSASCDVQISNTKISDIDLDTASGDLTMSSGSVERITVDSASGNVDIYSEIMPTQVDIDTASGDTTLHIPFEEDGFIMKGDTASGRLRVKYLAGTSIESKDNIHVLNGRYKYDLDSASGDFEIYEIEKK